MFKLISHKKIFMFLPILASSLLAGCSPSEVSSTEISQTEVKPTYSQVFKDQFISISQTFNEKEGFEDQYKLIQWDESTDGPQLPDRLTIASYSDEGIEIQLTQELSDLEYEMSTLIEKMSNVSLEDDELEELSEQYSEIMEQYSEEVTNVDPSIEPTDHLTFIVQSLIYATIGEEANEATATVIKEMFDGIAIIQWVVGMANAEYIDLIFNNLYLVQDEIIYGKLAYNKALNHDTKTMVQTFKFTKYYHGMAQEMKAFEGKLEELKELE